MKYTELGVTGLRPSIIGLGTNRIGSLSSGITKAQAHALISQARDLGINLIDTADCYGQGDSERRIGEVIRKNRDAYILATKAGFQFASFGALASTIKRFAKPLLRHMRRSRQFVSKVRASAAPLNLLHQNFHPDYIRRCVDSSLQRLRTGHIDLFFLHEPTPQVMQDEALFETLRVLLKEGKIAHFGVSSDNLEVLNACLAVQGLAIVQTPVNPLRPPGVSDLLEAFHKRGIGVIANQVFASGNITTTNHDELCFRVNGIANQHGIGMNDVLLKYAFARCRPNPVLVGTLNPEHLASNVRTALSPTELSEAEIESLQNITTPA